MDASLRKTLNGTLGNVMRQFIPKHMQRGQSSVKEADAVVGPDRYQGVSISSIQTAACAGLHANQCVETVRSGSGM